MRALLEDARAQRRTLVMGILNVTPDSFSDGGRFFAPDAALRHAEEMLAAGADIIDVGGESTRPGSDPLPLDEELRRVAPMVRALAGELGALVSVDTYKAAVAQAAVEAGAVLLNDVSGATFDPEMLPLAARTGTPICLMHIKGTPKDMQVNPVYEDVVTEVRDWLAARAEAALAAGVAPENIVLDPGFGFGKTQAHNLELIRRLREIADLGYPVLMGTSRKGTIGAVLGGLPPEERVEGTGATMAISVWNGATIIRVHDVKEMARVARMTDAILGRA